MTLTVVTTKVGEVESKIPVVSELVTTLLLLQKLKKFRTKIPNVIGLVNKIGYGAERLFLIS